MKIIVCLCFAVALVSASIAARAQNIVDASGKILSSTERKALFKELSNHLADPLSAQLRNLRKGKSPIHLCGDVNSKNKFGAYTGFQPFAGMVVADTAVVSFKPDDPRYMDLFRDKLRFSGC